MWFKEREPYLSVSLSLILCPICRHRGPLLFFSTVPAFPPYLASSFFRNERMESRRKCGLVSGGELLGGDGQMRHRSQPYSQLPNKLPLA